MNRNFFDFGNQSALVGAWTVVILVLSANIGYFIGRDIGRQSDLRKQQTQAVHQQRQSNQPDVENGP